MKNLRVIAFTHKHFELHDLGKLIVDCEELEGRLSKLKHELAIPELFYLGTCNRVEFVFYTPEELTDEFVEQVLISMSFDFPDELLKTFVENSSRYEGIDALQHMFRMSCSLESLVVGEKEILAQVRRAYEQSRKDGLTGDFLRLMMDHLVITSKEVYTRTNISRNPISVVSLAYRKLRNLKLPEQPRILVVGAGETNQNFAKYLSKHKYQNFAVFNRTLERAETFAAELKGKAFTLQDLETYDKGFDILVTCTGAANAVVNKELYSKLLNGEEDRKIIIDLAVPHDIDKEIIQQFPVHYIEIGSLQQEAENNIQERYGELEHAGKIIDENIKEFLPIVKQRRVEVAMREVPNTIKEIKSFALNEVFANDVDKLDPEAKETLEKVINYMEKKYIKVPMVMAKDILIQHTTID